MGFDAYARLTFLLSWATSLELVASFQKLESYLTEYDEKWTPRDRRIAFFLALQPAEKSR